MRLLMGLVLGLLLPEEPAPERRVPPVLDGVVGAARQEPGDLGPAVAEAVVCVDDDLVLGLSPRVLVDARAEVVAPALAALFCYAVGQVGSNG